MAEKPKNPQLLSDSPVEGETIVHAEERTMVHTGDPEPGSVEKTDEVAAYPRLEAKSGPLTGRTFLLPTDDGASFVIGRASDFQLVLDDGSVSRRHAEIVREKGVYFLNDMGSSNGTLINDQMISRNHPLRPGEVIRIGIYAFIFQDPGFNEADINQALTAQPPPQVPAYPPAEYLPPLTPPPISRETMRIYLIIIVTAAILLIFGVRKIIDDEKLHIGSIWKSTESGGNMPRLAYPYLDVRTAPFDGQIFFQDEFIGNAPLEKKITAGVQPETPFELRAEFDLKVVGEKVTVRQSVTFARNQEVASFLLRGPIGQIHVTKIPLSTHVLIEYQVDPEVWSALQGTGSESPPQDIPVKIIQPQIDYKEPINVPYGQYKFEIRQNEIFKYRRKFQINEAQPRQVFNIIDDDLTYAPLTILTDPPGAEVWLDDKRLELTTPLRDYRLPLGDHTVVLRKENFTDYLLNELPKPLGINEPLEFNIKLPITNVGELIVQAKRELTAERFQAMEKTLYGALKNQPPPTGLETAEIQFLLGECYLKQRDYKQALIYYRKSAQFEENKKKPFSCLSRLGEARVYSARKENTQALKNVVDVFFQCDELLDRTMAEEIYKKISPLDSVMHLDSDPSGSYIYLNAKKLQFEGGSNATTPMNIPRLKGGYYNILFTKEGYEDHQERIFLNFGELKAVKIKLKPK